LTCENLFSCSICNGENRNLTNFCFCNNDSYLSPFNNQCTIAEDECLNNKFAFRGYSSPGIAMGLLNIEIYFT
jgi:hypothetical protein